MARQCTLVAAENGGVNGAIAICLLLLAEEQGRALVLELVQTLAHSMRRLPV